MGALARGLAPASYTTTGGTTEQFKRVTYRRVEVASQRLIRLPSEWPEDLRWLLEAYLETPSGRSVNALYSPRFLVTLQDTRKLVIWESGLKGWSERLQPKLKKLVGA
ncbi:MAG TPA: hypothetical protein PK286_10575 [Devosia sp.]|nr:hypothetical protein [Devosia sp.]